MLTVLNVLMTVSGLSFTYLASKKSVYSNWFLLLRIFTSISMFVLLGLYTDAVKEVLISLPLALLSLFSWYRIKKSSNLQVSMPTVCQNAAYFVAFLFMWCTLYLIMRNFQENLVLLNTCIVSMGIIHMLYHARLYYTSWYIYIMLNVLYVVQFYFVFGISFDYMLIVVKNVIYTYLALQGLKVWRLNRISAPLVVLDSVEGA